MRSWYSFWGEMCVCACTHTHALKDNASLMIWSQNDAHSCAGVSPFAPSNPSSSPSPTQDRQEGTGEKGYIILPCSLPLLGRFSGSECFLQDSHPAGESSSRVPGLPWPRYQPQFHPLSPLALGVFTAFSAVSLRVAPQTLFVPPAPPGSLEVISSLILFI